MHALRIGFAQKEESAMLSRRTLLLKPMQSSVSGYARVQKENGHALIQLHARGLKAEKVRLFGLLCGHTARELGSTAVNQNGEASLEAEAPSELEALVLLGTPPKPLLIGLCDGQDGGALLDVKNAAMAIAERLQKGERKPEPEKPVKKPKSAPPAPVHPVKSEPSLPREIFLPAIDPAPYAAAAAEKEAEILLPPPRPTGPAVDRLKKLVWPRSFETLKRYFDTGMPCALLPVPGWRFVQASQGLWLGMQAQDGRVRRVAYAYAEEAPKEARDRCQSVQGLDGRMYQVLWMKL